MSHPLVDVVDFDIIADYTLRVVFDDGSQQVIDFRPVLYGEMFGPLRDLSLFNRVRLDSETATLTWPNQADFDPWTLHEWPRVVDDMASRARLWEAGPEY